MAGDETGGEDDRVAARAQVLAQRGWPAEQVMRAAEGAEVAGYPEERPFWERVAAEVDAIVARKRLRVAEPPVSGNCRR